MTTLTEDLKQTLYATHVDVRPLGTDKCLITTPSGEAFEIAAAPEAIANLLALCDGTRSSEQVLEGCSNPESFGEVLAVLHEEGCVRDHLPLGSPLTVFDLHLIGERALLQRAAAVVGPWRSIHFHEPEQLPELENPVGCVLVALKPYIDGDWLQRINDYARTRQLAWTQLHFDGGRGWLGPFVVPDLTSDYEDLLGRRLCAGDDVEGAQLRRPLLPEEGAPAAPWQPDPAGLDWMLTRLFVEIELALQDQGHILSVELEADPQTLTLKAHHILPLPTRAPRNWLASAASSWDRVLGSRTGVVLSQHVVAHHPSLPPTLTTVRSHCTDLSRLYSWGNDLFVGGSTFGDEPAARGASLGEALERYCGNCLPGVETLHGSYNRLTAEGHRVLDPQRMILHSAKMLAEPGCPFVAFTRDLPVHWVAGRSLTRSEPCLLPLSLVYANWMGGELKQPPTNYLYTPGMAAGENLERALVGAIRELVERDITMAWWLNAHPLHAVAPTPALEALWLQVPDRHEQKVRYIHLDNPWEIPVMVAVVENTRHKFLNIGFGCRPDPEDAARKALTEALTLQEGSRDLVLRDSTLRRSTEEWNLLSVPYRPWREDRSYMDDFRADYRDINDLMLQQQFFLDPRALERVRPLVDPPVTRRFSDLPRLIDDSFASYREPIEGKGFEILYADITSPDVALTEFRVVRTIVPGLIPNMPAAFPAVGGARVFDLPVQMGWRQSPLTEAELNYFPMPHA